VRDVVAVVTERHECFDRLCRKLGLDKRNAIHAYDEEQVHGVRPSRIILTCGWTSVLDANPEMERRYRKSKGVEWVACCEADLPVGFM
jgi:hypothetical protein